MEETTRNYIIKPIIIETSVSDEICQIESLDGDEPNEKNGTKLLIDQVRKNNAKKQSFALNLDHKEANCQKKNAYKNLVVSNLNSRKISVTSTLLGNNKFIGLSRNLHSITFQLKPYLYFLSFMGYFPMQKRIERMNFRSKLIRNIMFYGITLTFISINVTCFISNLNIVTYYHNTFGFLSPSCVSFILSGLKPLINIFYLSIFLIKSAKHVLMLEKFDDIELSFRNAFKTYPSICVYKFVSIALVLIATIPSLALRVVEVMAVDGQLYSSFFVNISYCLVPLLTLWNVLPLLYFEICNRLVRFWCRTLVKNIENENKFRKFNIRFYYIQFLKITKVQRLIGRVFNPFIFFSMAFSLLLVVFAIYFLTQQNNSLFEPLSSIQVRNETFRDYLTLKVKFTLGWATLQIFIALLYICVICYTGLRTNEQTRKVVKSILELVPVVDCESDRFQVQCFIHKMQTQYIWGMSLWKILPLERNTFFTIVSVIITYSVMLLKIKENETVPAVIFKNVTIT